MKKKEEPPATDASKLKRIAERIAALAAGGKIPQILAIARGNKKRKEAKGKEKKPRPN